MTWLLMTPLQRVLVFKRNAAHSFSILFYIEASTLINEALTVLYSIHIVDFASRYILHGSLLYLSLIHIDAPSSSAIRAISSTNQETAPTMNRGEP